MQTRLLTWTSSPASFHPARRPRTQPGIGRESEERRKGPRAVSWPLSPVREQSGEWEGSGDAVLSKGACSFPQPFPPASLGPQEGWPHRTLHTTLGRSFARRGGFKGQVAVPRAPEGEQATSLLPPGRPAF
uniref:Uncharacterized protein n=1 Tax=Molossus molossus TaxID=27622 RepID=A0A7J8BYD4_MOLMO|nr:hypothetical protein HJG59_010024 [Molossus molossus]